jgi:hypothetical protein
MIIDFKTNVGTAAYDSDTILKIEYTYATSVVGITYAAHNKPEPTVLTSHHHLKSAKEFDEILDQWKKSKETPK